MRFSKIIAATFFAISALGHAAEVPQTEAPKGKPSEPAWGFYKGAETGWGNIHKGLLAQTAKGGIDIVFLGDSLTNQWQQDGKDIWAANFAPLKAANYGVGSDSTRQVLWRIENGELDGLTPKVLVLMIGTNNIYTDYNSGTDAEIGEGVAKIIDEVVAKSPKTKVILLGVLPRQNPYFIGRTAALNKVLAGVATQKKAKFLDLSAKFLTSPEAINAELFKPDQVHLTSGGYQILGDAIKPAIDELLKP